MSMHVRAEVLKLMFDKIDLLILSAKLGETSEFLLEEITQLREEHQEEFRTLRKSFFRWEDDIKVPGFSDNEESEEEKKFNEWVNK